MSEIQIQGSCWHIGTISPDLPISILTGLKNSWGNILFTDKSRVSLRGADGREGVWRALLSLYLFRKNTIWRRVYHGMGWNNLTCKNSAGTSFKWSAHRYVEEVLMAQVVPFWYGVGENFILMQDNARPPVAQCVSLFLDTVGIEVMVCPSCSPDLNPILHLWEAY